MELAIYFYTFLTEHAKTFKIAENIVKQISVSLDLSIGNRVECLEAGNKLSVGGCSFEVLWPPPVVEHNEILRTYLQTIKATEDDDYRELVKVLRFTFSRWMDLTRQSSNMPEEERDLDALSEIRKDHDSVVAELDIYRGKVSQSKRDLVMTTVAKHHYTKLFSDSLNSTSIVFHSISPGYRTILMAGDIDANTFQEQLCAKKTNSWYYAFKVPHHGTFTHYTSLLPNACRKLISTGQRSVFGPISYQYKRPYNSAMKECIHAINVCTRGDSHCEVLAKNAKCANSFM